MRARLPAAAGALVVGAALLLSACGSSATSTSSHTSSTTSGTVLLHAGQNPCRLLSAQVIASTLNQRMAQVTSSKSICSYTNASKTNKLSISTAKTTPAGAEAAVRSAAYTAKVRVVHLSGVGDSAIAYIKKSENLSIATGLVAKNGMLVFLNVSGSKPNHLLPGAIALAKAAASNAS